jgi:hypothetical protein
MTRHPSTDRSLRPSLSHQLPRQRRLEVLAAVNRSLAGCGEAVVRLFASHSRRKRPR